MTIGHETFIQFLNNLIEIYAIVALNDDDADGFLYLPSLSLSLSLFPYLFSQIW